MPKKKSHFSIREVFRVNRLVKYFVLSDLMFMGGWGLVGPIFALFVVRDIPGTTMFTVGAVAAAYWFTKAVVQVPVALYIDKKRGERDDFHALIFSLLLSGFTSFSLALVTSIPTLFFVVIMKGVAFGFYTPSWAAIFSRHLDKKRYAFDWALDHASIGVAFGFAALVGGAVASIFGFKAIFVAASLLSFCAVMLLIFTPHLILPPPKSRKGEVRDHSPRSIGR